FVLRSKEKAAVAASPVAQTTNANSFRTSLSNQVVHQAANGIIGAGLFCRAGDDGDCGIPRLQDCEAAADQQRNQYGEFSRAAGDGEFRSAGNRDTGRVVLSWVARRADDCFVPWI